MISTSAYGQPFANSQLNSLSAAELGSLHGSILRAGAVNGRRGPIEWLLAGADAKWLVGAGPFAHWIIDRAKPTATTAIDVSGRILISMVPNGRYVFNLGSSLVLRRLQPFAGWHGDNYVTVRIDKFGGKSIPYGVHTKADELTLVMQIIGHPGNPAFKELCVSRAPYAERSNVRWSVCHAAASARSPFLSDGTLVLYFPDALRVIDADGKQTATIDAALKPGMVSVDSHDLIWGVSATAPELFAFNRLGKQVAKVPFSGGTPTQPPVALADGRVIVVTTDGLDCIKDQKIEWQAAFAKLQGLGPAVGQPKRAETPRIDLGGGQDPLATASADGKLLVKRGSWLMLFDGAPAPVWIQQVPGGKPITSNVAITSDGAAYFAAGLDYYRVE